MENPFVYRSPPPLSGDRLLRYQLLGKTNKELCRILGKEKHIRKIKLVDEILQKNANRQSENCD